jgi:hypothetical protein
MRRGVTPGQGANVCDLGRAAGFAALSSIKPSSFSDFFHDTAEPNINAISRMAPMTGNLLPQITESGLAKSTFTP